MKCVLSCACPCHRLRVANWVQGTVNQHTSSEEDESEAVVIVDAYRGFPGCTPYPGGTPKALPGDLKGADPADSASNNGSDAGGPGSVMSESQDDASSRVPSSTGAGNEELTADYRCFGMLQVFQSILPVNCMSFPLQREPSRL